MTVDLLVLNSLKTTTGRKHYCVGKIVLKEKGDKTLVYCTENDKKRSNKIKIYKTEQINMKQKRNVQ